MKHSPQISRLRSHRAAKELSILYDRNRATHFLNFIDDLTVLAIQSFDREELKMTGRLIKKFDDLPLTLADAHGLAIISQRKISACWSTDRPLGLTPRGWQSLRRVRDPILDSDDRHS